MRIVYYPGPESGSEVRLHKFVNGDLRRLSFKQWKTLDFFLKETMDGSLDDLLQRIEAEKRKKWKKRTIASLGDGLYEYRGKQSKMGTIRMYFAYYNDNFMILEAENKTSDSDKVVQRAVRRLKEMISLGRLRQDNE